MDNDILLTVNLLIDKEVANIVSLVSLKLNNLSVLLIIHNSTVAGEALLPGLQNQLQVQVSSQSLNSGDTFATVSLLNTNMSTVKKRIK